MKLFKNISNVYSSLKKGEKSPSLDNLIRGWSKSKFSKNKKILNNSISINTNLKISNKIIIHELIHSYLKREGHVYAKNEVVVEFLSSLFFKKYFLQNLERRLPDKNIERNQYYTGYKLSIKYMQSFGLNLNHINKYLASNIAVIEKNTLK